MKLLVLATSYPSSKKIYASMFVHTRNIEYVKNDLIVDVLNFSADENYEIDNISVYTKKSISIDMLKQYDIVISHAPNVKNHFKFLLKYKDFIQNIIFFFHGHEVLDVNIVYPKPYSYDLKFQKSNRLIRYLYDRFKLNFVRIILNKLREKTHLIFVSNWLLNEFEKWTKTDISLFENKVHIINNGIAKVFEADSYPVGNIKNYDFVTIRGDLDGSKYGVDIVNKLANSNPDLKFLLIGTGKYFEFNEKAKNITWINKQLNHKDMLEYVNLSRAALLPTRQDTQGVMACELATYGIPLITSNIDICHEMLSDFENVYFISNEYNGELYSILEQLESKKYNKIDKFYARKTVIKEIELFNLIANMNTKV